METYFLKAFKCGFRDSNLAYTFCQIQQIGLIVL